MNIGIFGLGSIGKRHLKNIINFSKKFKINKVYGYDIDKNRFKEFNKNNKLILTNQIDLISKNIDIAFICSPTSTHVDTINNIFNFNIPHIYLEKPFCDSLNGCPEIVEKLDRHKKILMMGYMLINHPVIMKLTNLIKKNYIGKIITARVEAGFYLPNWHPWEDYRNFYMSKRSGGGGALLDYSHEINYIEWLFGEIKEVTGIVGHFSNLDLTSDDLSVSFLKTNNNIIVELHLDLLQFNEERTIKIIGNEGSIKASLMTGEIIIFKNNFKKQEKLKLKLDYDAMYFKQYDIFFDLINGKKRDYISGKGGLSSMHVIEGIRMSNNIGAKINLPVQY